MTTLAVKIDLPYAESVSITEDTLNVDLSDGRTIMVGSASIKMWVILDFRIFFFLSASIRNYSEI